MDLLGATVVSIGSDECASVVDEETSTVTVRFSLSELTYVSEAVLDAMPVGNDTCCAKHATCKDFMLLVKEFLETAGLYK